MTPREIIIGVTTYEELCSPHDIVIRSSAERMPLSGDAIEVSNDDLEAVADQLREELIRGEGNKGARRCRTRRKGHPGP